MDIRVAGLAALVGYLVGSLSFARWVTYLWTSGKDIAQHEIGVDGTDERYKVVTIGANSASSMLGARAGMLIGVLDILKVFIPTLLCKMAFPEQSVYMLITAVAGLIGHVWPVYYRFHGGSGFSAILGGLLAIDWIAVVVAPVAGLLLGMLVFRNMIVANLAWIWLLIPWFWWRANGNPAYLVYALLLNVLFVLAMLPEFQTARRYAAQGKLQEYGMGNLKSNPMGRGMLRIAKFFGVEVK